MSDEEMKTVERMARFGGSFVKNLAKCFYSADPINFRKLKEAFNDYWNEYAKKL